MNRAPIRWSTPRTDWLLALVAFVLLLVIAAGAADAESLGSRARALPWQGVPAVMLDLLCVEPPDVEPGVLECVALEIVVVEIYGGSGVGWAIRRHAVPPALEPIVRGLAQGTQNGVRLDCDGTVRGLDAGVVPSWRWKPQHLNESTQPPPVRFDWSRYCATRPSAGEQRVTVDVSVIADGEAVSGSKTFTVCAPSTS